MQFFKNIYYIIIIILWDYSNIVYFKYRIAIDLNSKMLEREPSERYSAFLVLNHPWITGNSKASSPLTC